MPVITMSSPKGGAGKTTTTVVLATQLARIAPVAIFDADKNQPIVTWSKAPGFPDNITVLSDITDANFYDRLDEVARRVPFVLIDPEGTANVISSLAISAADLVIIPLQPSQLDADQAQRALLQVTNQERAARRKIATRVLFTRTSSALQTRTLRHLRAELAEAGVSTFDTQLIEREAFRALFSFGGTLEQLDGRQVSSPDKAIANARALATEVLAVLKEVENERAA
ncbi:MAG: ParA family protein [Brevundimonas sp.]|nr:ParA family protein [Brevundimonas sp.]